MVHLTSFLGFLLLVMSVLWFLEVTLLGQKVAFVTLQIQLIDLCTLPPGVGKWIFSDCLANMFSRQMYSDYQPDGRKKVYQFQGFNISYLFI